jgi:hypothetical protein
MENEEENGEVCEMSSWILQMSQAHETLLEGEGISGADSLCALNCSMTAEHACPTQNLGLGFEALCLRSFRLSSSDAFRIFLSECEGGGAPHSLRPSGMLLLQKSQLLFI